MGNGHIKGEDIVYGIIKIQTYLNTDLINSKQAKVLFKLQSRMVDVRVNFKNKYKNKNKNKNLMCPVCGDTTQELDSQQHLLVL